MAIWVSIHVLSDILLAIGHGDLAALILLDLTAAFDTVGHDILLFPASIAVQRNVRCRRLSVSTMSPFGGVSHTCWDGCTREMPGQLLSRLCVVCCTNTGTNTVRHVHCMCRLDLANFLAEEQQNKSAITDHVTRENHVIDWDQLKVIGHESDRKTRWIKEAISIRKCKDICMNRDSGSYLLPSSYDKLLRCDPAHFHRNDTTRRRVDSHF